MRNSVEGPLHMDFLSGASACEDSRRGSNGYRFSKWAPPAYDDSRRASIAYGFSEWDPCKGLHMKTPGEAPLHHSLSWAPCIMFIRRHQIRISCTVCTGLLMWGPYLCILLFEYSYLTIMDVTFVIASRLN